MFFAAAAMALSSCQKEIGQVETPSEGEFFYNFSISNVDNAAGADTKATLANDGTNLYLKWENLDSFGAFSTDGESNSNNRPSTVTVSGDSFTLKVASTVQLASGSTVYTYFPYNSGAGTTRTNATIKIDPIQTQKATGFDASVMPMAGEPYTTATILAKDDETTVGTINFANLGAIVEFNIYATSAIEEQIKSVQFNSNSGNPAGNFTLNLTTVDFSDDSTLELKGSGSAASVKTDLETPVDIPLSTTSAKEGTKVYMAVAPGDYAGTVVVTTTGHTYTFNVTSAKTFNRSKVKRLNANLSTATVGDLPVEETWEVVTSASDFTEGTYVIVSSDKASYLVNDNVNKNPSSAAAHWDAGGNLTSVTDDAKWIATTSGTGLQFASYANSADILWMSTSTAQGVTVASSSTISGAAKVWSIEANATLGGESGFIATTGGSRYLALYTNGTWRGYTITDSGAGAGAGYLNGNSDIKAAIFYKLVDSRTALDTPTLTVTGTLVSWSAISNAGSYLVSINSDEHSINTTSIDLDDYSLSDGEYTVTVIAVPSNTTTYKNSLAASTTVAIGEPQGTSTNPYTASAAITKAATLGSSTIDNVYVKGIVCTTGSISSGSVTYYISDDGTETNRFELYKGKYISGADFTDATNLKVGDFVVVCGTLSYYSKYSQAELNADNEVVSVLHAPSFDPDGGEFTTDSQTIEITADSGAQIRYTTGGTAPTATTGTVYNSTFSITETTTVNAIAVKDGNVTGVVSKVFTKKNTDSVTETLTVGTNGNTTWSNGVRTESATVGNVTFTALYSVANDGKYYSSDTSWRFYTANDSGVKITVPSGKKITSVKITWKTGIPKTPSGFTADGSTTPTTYTADSGTNVNEVSFVRNTANFLARVIEVTYE